MDTKTVIRIRISFAVIGLLVGLSIFFTFGFVYSNWHCAVWGLASGVFAAITLWLHFQFKNNHIEKYSTWLSPLIALGTCVQVTSVSAFIIYLVIAIMEHQKVTPYGNGFYVTAVWAAMTWKWSFLLFWYSRKYRLLLSSSGMDPDTGYERI